MIRKTRKPLLAILALLMALASVLKWDPPRHDRVSGKPVVCGAHVGWYCHLSSLRSLPNRQLLRPTYEPARSYAAHLLVAVCGGHNSLTTSLVQARSTTASPSLQALHVMLQI